jgi:hypothetical protein
MKPSHVMPSSRSFASSARRICSGLPDRMWIAFGPVARSSRSSGAAPGMVRLLAGDSTAVRSRSRTVSNSVRR